VLEVDSCFTHVRILSCARIRLIHRSPMRHSPIDAHHSGQQAGAVQLRQRADARSTSCNYRTARCSAATIGAIA
jgi:hypothetical protein